MSALQVGKIFLGCTLGLILGLARPVALRAGDGVPAGHYRITDKVAVPNPPKFSANCGFGGFAPWSIDQHINAWNLFYNLEPMVFQHHGQCDGGGEDFAEHSSGARFSWWDCARSGFWDGAEIRFYRLENGELRLLRTTTVTRSVIGNDPKTGQRTEERLYLADKGPIIRSGDFYVLRMQRTEVPPQFRPELNGNTLNLPLDGWANFQGKVPWKFDPSTFAPEGGSTASLRMEIAGASSATPMGPWHWFIVTNQTDLCLNAGKSYRMQVWLKQTGMQDPRVLIQLGTITNFTVNVGTTWQKFECDLPWENPQSPYAFQQTNSTRLLIGALSDGTLWMDNLLVWQTDVPPFAVLPKYVAALREFQPAAIRLWGGLDAPSLDYWLSDGFAQLNKGEYGKSGQSGHISLQRTLELCESVGADPWLILNPFFSAEEHAQLMEYLAGPAGQGYGAVRARLGRRDPWTKAFKQIHFESSNESWNSMFKFNWTGHPEVYAAIADRQFRELKQSPFYERKKFDFIANGWDSQMGTQGWTHRLALTAQQPDRIDVACYFGGWEKGAGHATETDEIYQDKLLATPIEYGRKQVDALVLDNDLTHRLCAAIAAQPALLTQGLARVRAPKVQWPVEQLSASATLPPAVAIRELWAQDAKFVSVMQGVLVNRRSALERVIWQTARLVLAQTADLQAPTLAALDLDEPAILEAICEGLGDLNAPSRLTPILAKHPAVIERWQTSPIFGAAAKKDLAAVAMEHRSLTYNITNDLDLPLRRLSLDMVAKANPQFLDALGRSTTPQRIQAGLALLDYLTRTMFSEPAQRRTEQLMLAMKQDPVFGMAVTKELAKDTAIFHAAAQEIAQTIATNMAAIYSGTGGPRPDDELLVRRLPPALTRELLTRMQEQVTQSAGNLSPETRIFLTPMLQAVLGNPQAALDLQTNAVFIAQLEQQMTGALPLPFLEAGKQDARFGDQLLAVLAQTGAAGKTGLAVYEGGPGYALPGPGKKSPEDDENLGKSLVMGTATLDVYMQFLAAGAAPLAYYDFKSGPYWASHNNPREMIPYPSWLSLEMRNRYCTGDLMVVDRLAEPTVDVPDKEIIRTTNDGKGTKSTVTGRSHVPLTTCYAFRDGKRSAILFLNRSLREKQTVQLDFPFAKGHQPTRIYELTNSDPKAHNRFVANVQITERAGPVLKTGMTVEIPPASVFLLVETAK